MFQHLKCDYAVMIVYCIYSIILLRLIHNSADLTATSTTTTTWNGTEAKPSSIIATQMLWSIMLISSLFNALKHTVSSSYCCAVWTEILRQCKYLIT